VTVTRLSHFLTDHLPYDWRITVVDNASTDGTRRVAEQVAAVIRRVDVLRLERKGRGGALRNAWSRRADELSAAPGLFPAAPRQ
jgi:glycosyltransferase involved in cell wall biosynthesis